MSGLICFDLEGPLSTQDNAYEVMGLIPNGHKVFEVISRYDDLLALEGREGYEPGDTLALIVPFLVGHGITEEAVRNVSGRAPLVNGSRELIARLQTKGWSQYIVSTSYEQHAHGVTGRLGLESKAVVCTRFPLDELRGKVNREELALLSRAEEHILNSLHSEELECGAKDKAIKPYLDRFYWEELPRTAFGIANKRIEVVGGRRKVWAIERIAREHGVYLEGLVFVGDSITDAQGARVVEAAGGLSIAFNGNAFVVPYATVGIASTDLGHLEPVLDAWLNGGREGVKATVKAMPRPQVDSGPYYDWLVGRKGKPLTKVLAAHKRARALVRGEAAKLG
jgi:energy-converting hydrogenase A subunit R